MKRYAKGAKVWAVLKADGYGHGAPAVARTLERAGADGFCVALIEEAVELREAGILAPIVVMGGCYGAIGEEILEYKLTPVVYDASHVEALARVVRARGSTSPLSVHLKVDTGMARLGVSLSELAPMARNLARAKELSVVGFMTHLAKADAPTSEETRAQLVRFEDATRVLAREGIVPKVRHAANTAALVRGEAIFDAVRPGIGIFGVSPRTTEGPLSTELLPVMRVRTEIVDLREIPAGTPVGYGGLFVANRPTRLATIPMGYADGVSRALSNKGRVVVRGVHAPIVGAISMDLATIDVTHVPQVSLRDEVVLLGAQEGPLGQATVTADEIAEHAGTIAWEVLTSVSRRVPRFYREP